MPNYGPKIVSDSLILCADAARLNATYATFNTNDTVTELAHTVASGSGESLQEVGTDPWGQMAVLRRSVDNDASSNYDGGYTGNTYAGIDTSSKYRYTYWFRVDRKGSDGRLYFGLYAYNSSNQNVGIYSSGGVSSTTNPYFSYPMHNSSGFQEGRWYMFVAYVHPEGTTGASDDTAGFYDMVTKEKISNPSSGNVNHNSVWVNATTKTKYRYS